MIWITAIYGAMILLGFCIARYRLRNKYKNKNINALLIGLSWPLAFLLIPALIVAITVESINDAWESLIDS